MRKIMSKMGLFAFILLGLLACSAVAKLDLDAFDEYLARSRRQSSRCGLDLVFVLDDSRSIYFRDFGDQKQFLKNAIDRLNVGPGNTHVGVMAFSNTVVTNIIPLGNFAHDVRTLKAHIDNIQQREGDATFTHEALRKLPEMFVNARPNVPHVAVIITDGESTIPEDTSAEAERVRRAGDITLFAVGVGGSYNLNELNAIASNANYVLEVKGGYSALSDYLEQLTTMICEVTTLPPTTTALPCSKPLDVLFSAPDQAGIDDTAETLSFIKDVIRSLVMGPDSTQVGLTPRLGEEKDGITLEETHRIQQLEYAINDRELTTTDLPEQLKYILQSGFSARRGARPGANRVAILIVDNESYESRETSLLAREVKDSGVVVMTIAVGPHANQGQLRAVASDKEYQTFYSVRRYDGLGSVQIALADSLCSASEE